MKLRKSIYNSGAKLLMLTCLVVALFANSSCRKLVQSEFPYFPPKPVVNSILIADSLIKVHVSLASKLDTNELLGINNAVVLLYVNDTFKEQLTYADSGFYHSSITAVPLSKYECKVIVAGYDTASASCTLPARARVFNPVFIAVVGKDQEGNRYPGLKFSFSNDNKTLLYYEAKIIGNNDNDDLAYFENQTDPVLINEAYPRVLFSNELIQDTVYTMKANLFTDSYDYSSLIIEFRSVSFEYYAFLRQKYLYDQGRFPDFELGSYQGYQLYSNIKNGYGIFAGYSAVHSDTIAISK